MIFKKIEDERQINENSQYIIFDETFLFSRMKLITH